MSPVPPNPYIVGNPLTDLGGYGFFGRQNVYNFLLEKLNAVRRPAILLHGHRRIGKTSILRQMQRFLPPDSHAIFFDTQGQAYDPLDEILHGIAYEIDIALNLGGIDQEDIDADKFRNQFLPRVFGKLDGHKNRLILLFDEFDVLDTGSENARKFLQYLRSLMIAEQEIGYVFVVGRRPEHLPEIFRDISTIVYYIGRLTKAETEDLVRQPARDIVDYSDEAIQRIWELTAGHPLATQLICFELWPRWAGQGIVPAKAVNEIIPNALSAGDNQLNQIYDGLDKPGHRLFLSAVAEVAGANGVARLDDIMSALRRYQVNIAPDLNEIRRDLVNWDILIDQEQSFVFTVDLVRRWVQNNRSLERMRHDAMLVSERAYNFFRTAEDLRLGRQQNSPEEREKDLELAVSNYQRALQINPILVAARVGLANVAQELGDFEKAVDEIERAYEADPAYFDNFRDILLKYGEYMEEQGERDRALQIYDRILDLGENQEAQSRRRRILILNGEILLNE